MDPQVMIKAIEAIQTILGRINSKRIISFFAYLYFLTQVLNPLAMWLGTAAWAFLIIALWRNPGGDKLNAN